MRDAVRARYHDRTDPEMFNLIWSSAEPSYPKTVEVNQSMVDRIVDFVNETQPDPLDKTQMRSAWSNDYAARALA
ncbi:hypothetical protein ACFQU7_41930 [Pseudoroseomonas wenyumeiae]